MGKSGFTRKEARGAIYLLAFVLIIIGAKFFYDNMERRALTQRMIDMVDSLNLGVDPRFEFDPNTVQLPELMSMGLSRSEAVSIIRYRSYGKVFRIKEDLFTCYGISDSLYYSLEPYIVIADTFRLKRRDEYSSYSSNSSASSYSTSRYRRKLLAPSPFLVDTVGVKYLVAIGSLSRRQAEVFVKWRNLSGIYNMEELRECYVISDSIATALEPYAIFTTYEEPKRAELIDINRADSATLRSVFGIGEKSVEAILTYRNLLGGFYCVEQLTELKVVTESNYEKIIKQISCDSCDISKIDVNFASAKRMKGHPYITNKALRRLLKMRELKGGWSTIEEMIDDDIFNKEEAARLRPYTLFGKFESHEILDDGFF
ncbi:MAG: helix-hairpin-helix domain-containing protein [Rikenellaceae bacterium]